MFKVKATNLDTQAETWVNNCIYMSVFQDLYVVKHLVLAGDAYVIKDSRFDASLFKIQVYAYMDKSSSQPEPRRRSDEGTWKSNLTHDR